MKNLSSSEFRKLLTNLRACSPAMEFANGKGLKTVWDTCERGDWMLWLLGKMADKPEWLTRKEVVSIACDCAETALQYVRPGEDRPRKCIETVRQWVAGIASIDDVKEARRAAYAAAYAADAAYAAAAAAYAADAAAYAADAAYAAAAAAYAADAAAYAADAADAAAYAAAYAADARKDSLKQTADMCRKYFQIV